MKKKVLPIVLALIMVLGFVPALVTPTHAAAASWQDAYADVLNSPQGFYKAENTEDLSDYNKQKPYFKFSLRDIDNNGVPELIVRWDMGYDGHPCEVYTYSNGIKDLGSIGLKGEFSVSNNPEFPGLLYCSYAYNGTETYGYSTIKNNELTNEVIFQTDKGLITKNNATLVDEMKKAQPIPTYSISDENINNVIYNYGKTNITSTPHPYATALREYFKDATGYKAAYLADINGDGTEEMVAHKDTPNGGPECYRLFYFYNGKLCTYDKAYAQGSLFVSQSNYLVDYSYDMTTDFHILTISNGNVIESTDFLAYYDDDPQNPTYYQNSKTISKSEYDALRTKYGVSDKNLFISGSDHVNRPDQTAQILAMTTTTGTTASAGNQNITSIKASNVARLAGADRYKTAVAISQSGWTQSDNVILVDGNNYPDALVGSSYAYLKNAPILTTPSDKLNSDISAEIARLKAKTVYILGNTTSVSQGVEDELSQKYTVVRICGTDIFDTAVKVGEEIRKTNKFDTVALAAQNGFADALAMAPFSARNTMPLLFSGKDSLRPDTLQALKDWNVKNVVIVGGTGVVSSAVEDNLKSMGITVTRLAGQDRYATALEIIKHFAPSEGYKSISICAGENFPDALTGAALAAKNNTPLVLVSKESVKDAMAEYINKNTLDKSYIFGGTGVVSDKVIGK